MIFVIKTCQFYDLSETKQWKLNRIRYFSIGHRQILHDIFFYIKMQSISMTFKIKNLSFMTKVNPNNGNETKSDIF